MLMFWQWFQANAESILVGLYTAAVVLYLAWISISQRLLLVRSKQRRKLLLRAQQQQQQQAGGVPTAKVDEQAVAVVVVTDEQQQPVNLTGAYKLVSNQGFEEFLAVQGVPWALRRAANQARPTHRITHKGNQLTIKIEGIIESQTTYVIGGPPVETNVRGRIFEDSVEYLKSSSPSPDDDDDDDNNNKRGILVSKRALTEDYDVTVQRELSEDGRRIFMTSTAYFRDGRESVQSVQIFERCE